MCKPRQYGNTQFSGVEIETTHNGFSIHQKSYINKIKMPEEFTFKTFLSIRSKLAWIAQTRPDVACSVALLAQITEEAFEKDPSTAYRIVKGTLKKLQEDSNLYLRFPKLDRDSLQLYVYTDASYYSNKYGSSQLGYIIFLVDKHKTCQPLYWSSHKSKRTSRSVLGSEAMALADGFDVGFDLFTK